MEERKPRELNEVTLDQVNGGGFALVPQEQNSQTSLSGKYRCGNCGHVDYPKVVDGELCCPNCNKPL